MNEASLGPVLLEAEDGPDRLAAVLLNNQRPVAWREVLTELDQLRFGSGQLRDRRWLLGELDHRGEITGSRQYRSRRRPVKAPVAAIAVCLVLLAGGCGPDDRGEFVACLTERGGSEVTGPEQLARLDWRHAEDGGGVALDHLAYSLVELPSGSRRSHALVVLDAGLRDDALARAVRKEPERFRSVVLMPPRADADSHRPVEDCVDEAAPGELFP
jgi:hypothetical protein